MSRNHNKSSLGLCNYSDSDSDVDTYSAPVPKRNGSLDRRRRYRSPSPAEVVTRSTRKSSGPVSILKKRSNNSYENSPSNNSSKPELDKVDVRKKDYGKSKDYSNYVDKDVDKFIEDINTDITETSNRKSRKKSKKNKDKDKNKVYGPQFDTEEVSKALTDYKENDSAKTMPLPEAPEAVQSPAENVISEPKSVQTEYSLLESQYFATYEHDLEENKASNQNKIVYFIITQVTLWSFRNITLLKSSIFLQYLLSPPFMSYS